jgi:DNA-binding MarR family transcriptional regulator
MIIGDNDLTSKPAVGNGPLVGVSFLLSQVGAHAAFLFGERLSGIGLKPHHAGILRMLGSRRGLSQRALGDLFGLFPSRLVGLLDDLERSGLVARRDNPADRRAHVLELNAPGKRILAEIEAMTRALESELCASLNDEELETLSNLLRRIAGGQRLPAGIHPAFRQLGES